MESSWDLIIIGSGPGGYPAAIRAAQNGLQVLCVERASQLGGTCLNSGCIPSKALLASSHLYQELRHKGDLHGIMMDGLKVNLGRMQGRKQGVVESLEKGIRGLFKKYGVTLLQGQATLTAPGQVEVEGAESHRLTAKHILLATGSQSWAPASMPIDGEVVISSTEALALTKVPQHLVVIGSGAVGLEMGSVWARLGAEVTVIEAEKEILPGWDATIARTAKRSLRNQNFTFLTGHRVAAIHAGSEQAAVSCENAKGETVMVEGDRVLVAVGRRADPHAAGADALGVVRDGQGDIVVDAQFQTNIPGLYAVGDLITGPKLAHRAMEEGVWLADTLAGRAAHRPGMVPGVVYTDPELAMAGMTEAAAKAEGIPVKCAQFPFMASGRARAQEAADGLIKLVKHAETGKLLGIHVVGGAGGEHLSTAMLAMEEGLDAEKLAQLMFPHPSFGEALKEAAIALDGKALHL
uniref:Dihydrolipoyl dehydrogenase n=1 Tax=Magnetococcus massalia (strain MO-1) TaxID=451514 RepID=A0A1S7LEW3_MAGMO|nr:Dihydrolipoyl dehydrogenase, mitochondrial [Candidatus Magnetococcus massalia]